MGASQKLNGIAFAGCGAVAGLIGVAAQSWWVFLVALGLAAGWAVLNGDIRPNRTRR